MNMLHLRSKSPARSRYADAINFTEMRAHLPRCASISWDIMESSRPSGVASSQVESRREATRTERKNDHVLFRLSLVAALQSFCAALVQTDVPVILMKLHLGHPERYAAFASRQASLEKVADLFFIVAGCALSDRFGRRPLQVVTGGLIGILWNLFCFFIPTSPNTYLGWTIRNRTKIFCFAAIKLLNSACCSAFLAVNACAISDVSGGDPGKVISTSAAAQSYVGLAVVIAPLIAIQLRSIHRRAPFALCALLMATNLQLAWKLPETLPVHERTSRIAWSQALNPLASATTLLRQCNAVRLCVLSLAYSLVSIPRCADFVLQAFTGRTLRWGRNESAKLLSFWGATVFLGSQAMRRALKHIGPDAAVLIGAPFLAAQELLKSITCAWWHLPAALILGLPSSGVEHALKAIIIQEAQHSTKLSIGTVQAALKTQQSLTIAFFGSPLIGFAFVKWASKAPLPRFAWHYVICGFAALSCGILHAIGRSNVWMASFREPAQDK